MFAGFVIGLWYPVWFIRIEKQPLNKIWINYLTAGLIFLILWIWAGTLIMSLLGITHSDYLHFLYKSQPLRFFLGGLLYTLYILFFYLYVYYVSFRNKLKTEGFLEARVKETQLELLKSQLNPHFIFNSLNSISSLTLSNPEKAREMVVKLSTFLRYSLGNKSQRLVNLREEIENCRLYLDIEKIRFGNRLHLEIVVPESCESCQIPDMLLQPLFENAIKHGVYESIEPVIVKLTVERIPGFCKITLSNSFEEAGSRTGKGIGLKNVRERLQLVYGSGDLMIIDRKDHLYKVILRIPQQ